MTLNEVRSTRRGQILEIAAKHGVTRIRVFGSVARGESKPDSDLDLLIDFGTVRTPFFPGGFIADLQDALGCRIDVATERSLNPLIRQQVLAEAVAL